MELEGHTRLAQHDEGSAARHSDDGLCPHGDNHALHREDGVDPLLDEGQRVMV